MRKKNQKGSEMVLKKKREIMDSYRCSAELEVMSLKRNLPLWMLGMQSVLIQNSLSLFHCSWVVYHTEFGFLKKCPELSYDIYKYACTR